MFTGVNSGKRHDVPASDNQQSPRSTGRVLLRAIQHKSNVITVPSLPVFRSAFMNLKA
jgi:hypothetical protein